MTYYIIFSVISALLILGASKYLTHPRDVFRAKANNLAAKVNARAQYWNTILTANNSSQIPLLDISMEANRLLMDCDALILQSEQLKFNLAHELTLITHSKNALELITYQIEAIENYNRLKELGESLEQSATLLNK